MHRTRKKKENRITGNTPNNSASRAKRAKRSRVVQDDSMEVGDGEFTERHQVLLTYLMHTRLIKQMDLSRVHQKLFSDTESLSDSLSLLTSKIDALKMDIKNLKDDISGETYYVYTAGESFFPRCSMFSKSQLDFLRQVLTGIVLSSEGFIERIKALSSCQSLTKSEADETLGTFVKEKILIQGDADILYLSPLAIVEFGPYFKTCFSPSLFTCDLCTQLVFVGITCQGCKQKFHKHCVSIWSSRKNTECPKCFKAAWLA